MLDSMRKSAGSWIVKAFLGLLVLSFAAWGIGDLLRVQPETTVAEVGDREISIQAFDEAFQRDYRRLRSALGSEITRAEARDLGLAGNTLQQLITMALYGQAAQDLGLTVSDEAVRQEILNDPAFKNDLGRFDRARFETLLRENGYSEAGFVAATKRDFAREQLLGSIAEGAVAPDSMVTALFLGDQERRVARVLRLPVESIRDVPEPSAQDLAAYHEQNAARFMAPEYRALTFVVMTAEGLSEEIAVSEADLRQAYESRRAEFEVPERREVEQILLREQAAAEQAAERLAEGGDFYQVAQEVANMDQATVKLGTFSRGGLPFGQTVADAVFALSAGEVSGPLQSAIGWHIFRVTEVKPGERPSFEEVKDRIKQDIQLERATDALYQLANDVDDALAGGAALEEVATRFGLRHGKVTAVDRRGFGPGGEPVAELPDMPEFLSTAFSSSVGEEPLMHESGTAGYYLVRVDEIIEPAVKPLEAVREQVRAAWIEDKRAELADEKAEALASQARQGTALPELADQSGAELQQTEPLRRQGFISELRFSEATVASLFTANVGDIVEGSIANGEARLIVRLEEIVAAEPDANAEARKRIADSMRQSMRGDLLAQFRNALESRYDVTVNERALARLFEGG